MLWLPQPIPDPVQIQELIVHRSFTLGYPMQEPEARILAEAAIDERGSIALPLILAIIEIESKYDRKAKSQKHCRGLMQLSKGTAKAIAKRLGMLKFDPHDIRDNLKIGVNYLAMLLEENGTIEKALTIYNKGWRLFVAHAKKTSGYTYAVLKRSKVIKRQLENNLTCIK
jgi:soluble lytic murein transglycosylase-like protein